MAPRGKIVAVVTAAIALAWIGTALALARPGEASAARSHHVVEIRGLQFRPAELIVIPGDTVTWINRDIVPHTASAVDADWNSGKLEQDESWQWVVRGEAGEEYYCEYHPSMRGRLTISDPSLSLVSDK